METQEKKRGVYKKYLNVENPEELMPKTTKWQRNKRMKIVEDSQESTEIPEQTCTASEGRNDCDDSRAESGSQPHYAFDTPHQQEKMDDQRWFSSPPSDDNWYQINEESVWFDELHDMHTQENDNNDKSDSENCCNEDDSSVYEGARITVAQSAILILSFALRHNLTGECLTDLLTLISLHCATTAFIHQSLYKFRSYFSTLKSPIIFHKFCAKCERMLDGAEENCTYNMQLRFY